MRSPCESSAAQAAHFSLSLWQIQTTGFVPGATYSGAVTSADIMPTLLSMAGMPPQTDVDGGSFVVAMLNRAVIVRPLYWHYPHYGNQGGTPSSAIRLGQWKLIEFFEDGRLELYDLSNDVGETKDLAKEEPERVKELHAILQAWREKFGAKMPTPNPDFVANP